jgi:hypothetical protein
MTLKGHLEDAALGVQRAQSRRLDLQRESIVALEQAD